MSSKQASTTPAQRTGTLKTASLGVPAIVFFVVAAAAPLAATLGAGPLLFTFAGAGAPAMYVIASGVLLLFGIGFAAMSRHHTSAGGFAAFAAKGLGRYAGYATAGVAILAYAGMLIGLFGQFAVFTADLFSSMFGLSVPWQVIALVGLVVVGVFGYLDVRLSAGVLGVLMILEVLVLLVFDVAVIASGGADGLTLDAFAPANVFTPAMGAGLLFAFSCFVGFEATVIYGEEARSPKKTVARATYTAILAIGIIYTLTMFAIGLAYGSGAVQNAAIDNPVEFVFAVNTQYVGEWSTVIMRILVVTSLFAVLLAFHNTLSRYLFSLGRARLLATAFARTHPRYGSPSVASIALTVVTAVVLVTFMLAQADPFLNLYLWLVGIGTLGVLILQAAGAAAVVGYFLRNRRESANPWSSYIAPALGGIGLIATIVFAVVNTPLLTGVTDGPLTLLPVLLIVAALAGLIAGIVRSRGGQTVDLVAEAESVRGADDPS
ncbi:APC family permease [soil metagenome]